MQTYNQTTIKNNIIYFPLWRIHTIKYSKWTWEQRYLATTRIDSQYHWSHNCRIEGAILLENVDSQCTICGAYRENEPTTESIMQYMDVEYE